MCHSETCAEKTGQALKTIATSGKFQASGVAGALRGARDRGGTGAKALLVHAYPRVCGLRIALAQLHALYPSAFFGSTKRGESANVGLGSEAGPRPPHPRERERRAGPLIRAVRERAAAALDDDFPDVLEALRRGLKDKSAATAARTAIAYVQLVYGRQLQQPEDETPPPVEELDVSRMTIAERESFKRRILARHPHLAEEILGDDA
jgi:hypothetical protein